MTLYSAIITLILVMDPIGNVPVVLSLLKGYSTKRQSVIIFREMAIAFVILVLFLFFGAPILSGVNISESALEIAGGIILFIIAIHMIFPSKDHRTGEEVEGEPFVVPLAVPLMAGPSAMATVILFSTQEPEHISRWFIAVCIASFISLVILLSSPLLMRLLGKRGLIAMERLMGMLLTTISVQMFLDGVKLFLA